MQICSLASEEIVWCSVTSSWLDFSHHGGMRWEGGIEPDKPLAYPILIPRTRGIQQRESAQSKENTLSSGTYVDVELMFRRTYLP